MATTKKTTVKENVVKKSVDIPAIDEAVKPAPKKQVNKSTTTSKKPAAAKKPAVKKDEVKKEVKVEAPKAVKAPEAKKNLKAPEKKEAVAAPKEVKKVAAPKETKKVAAPKETKKVAAPKETKKVAAPKETKKVVAPKEVKKVEAPKKDEVKKEAKKKILFVASEGLPFIKTGGLADVIGALPQALIKKGYDARVVLPLYMDIPAKFKDQMEYIGNCYVTLAWRYQYCGVFKLVNEGVTFYFLDNEYYFKRHGLYGHYDDGERFAFFSKAVLEALGIMDFRPDIIHSHDWHTALTPVFLDSFYRGIEECKNIKTVFTIHNIEFQGKYGDGIINDVLGLPYNMRSLVEMDGCANFMKGGIECANKVTTVSPTYAQEILTPFYGYDMQKILCNRHYKLSGIINGIDVEKLNPMTDKALFENFDINSIEKKVKNKLELQKLLGLPIDESIPMIGMVGRLTHQKGLDLLAYSIEKMLNMEQRIQLVILGTGDWKYENLLVELQNRYPGKLKAIINFSSDMASKIYGASDMFLMPSKFEPCGLSQMIAMRYGSIPIVRETGGLKDTVPPFNHEIGQGRGFTFVSYNADDMFDAVKRAVGLYYDYKDEWKVMLHNAMSADFSWDNIANQYIELYESL